MSGRRQEDRGLRAVARVREVRERDSRLGLRSAAEEHRAHLEKAEHLQELVSRHAIPHGADGQAAADWAARRGVLLALAAAARLAHEDAASAALLRTVADEHWRRDRTRLRAVETLLERRADRRRDDAARASARELDDISSQLWLRRKGER